MYKSQKEYVGVIGQIGDAISILADARHQREIDNITQEMEAAEEKYKQEEDYINRLTITDEEREKRLADLKGRNTLRELSDKRRLNDAKRRQASAQKTADTTEAIGQTAIAVMSALKVKPWYVGVALAAAAGITGAAQIAAIQSAPLPQYFTGTDSAKPGLGTWGERGRELMVNNDGTMELSPNNTTPRIFEGGEKIYNAQETAQIMKNGMLKSLVTSGKKITESDYYLQRLISVNEQTGRQIVKAISGIKANPTIIIQDNSYYKHISRN